MDFKDLEPWNLLIPSIQLKSSSKKGSAKSPSKKEKREKDALEEAMRLLSFFQQKYQGGKDDGA